MKKLLFILLLAGITGGAYAQKGFRVGVKGAMNSTWLFNKNVSDAGEELDYKSSFGSQIGAMFLYNFNDNAGISAEVLFSTVNQKYINRIVDSTGFFPEIKLETQDVMKAIDIPLLFRYRSNGGVYFEIGPQFSLISSIDTEYEGFFGFPGGSISRDEAAGMYTSAVIGLGYDVELAASIYLNAGLRFAWGLGDVFDEDEAKSLDPFLTDYEPTNAAVGGIHVGLSYLIGGSK